jgi:hypothetical protein
MGIETIWLLKLILSHLLTDFVLQPKYWVQERNKKHFATKYLYLHGLVTAAVAYIFIGWQYWYIALIILVTHILIDGWKSYREQNSFYFLIDQLLHLLVIAGCFYFTFLQGTDILNWWNKISVDIHFWKLLLAVVFLTMPAGILIGLLTKKWRGELPIG